MESPFDVLGIDPDADEEEVTQAYRRRVMQAHPDHGGSRREFQLVRKAYEEITSVKPEAVSDVEPVDGAKPPRVETRVRYLNYETLDDYGWSLDDEDLFEKASAADLDPVDYGRFLVEPHETLLEAAERTGFTWPYACRGGACVNCAVAVSKGEIEMSIDHVLPPEMTAQGFGLSCIGGPTTNEMNVVYNVKHIPELEELLLPPGPFLEQHPNG